MSSTVNLAAQAVEMADSTPHSTTAETAVAIKIGLAKPENGN